MWSKAAVVFINLDHRSDRLAAVQPMLRDALGFPQAKRLPATPLQPGAQGCTASHIRAAQQLLVRVPHTPVPYGFVFEDDFALHGSAAESQQRLDRVHERFLRDPTVMVVMLARNPVTVGPVEADGCAPVTRALTSSGYAIRHSYLPTLIASLQTAFQRALPLDVQWQALQRRGGWWSLEPPLGHQAAGFSDIEGRHVDYSVHEGR